MPLCQQRAVGSEEMLDCVAHSLGSKSASRPSTGYLLARRYHKWQPGTVRQLLEAVSDGAEVACVEMDVCPAIAAGAVAACSAFASRDDCDKRVQHAQRAKPWAARKSGAARCQGARRRHWQGPRRSYQCSSHRTCKPVFGIFTLLSTQLMGCPRRSTTPGTTPARCRCMHTFSHVQLAVPRHHATKKWGPTRCSPGTPRACCWGWESCSRCGA